MHDLHDLPKFRDGLSYLYVEHCRVDQEAQAIAVHDAFGRTPVPVSSLAVLMLGPGTTVTHAAIKALADNGCLAVWCGEQGVRFYAQGLGETRSAARLLRQAQLCSNDQTRLEVVMRMYQIRFPEPLDTRLSIQQIRGMEGVRVRSAYQRASREYGVPWEGRSYKRDDWRKADPVNRALSAANACLYGLCHAAILSAGYSPALGFIHSGKQLSFVYDIADLYKADLAVPVAFQVAAQTGTDVDRLVRLRCRDAFREQRLLQRVIPDIERVLDMKDFHDQAEEDIDLAADPACPTPLWSPHGHPDAPLHDLRSTLHVSRSTPAASRSTPDAPPPLMLCADSAPRKPPATAPPPSPPSNAESLWPQRKSLDEEINEMPW